MDMQDKRVLITGGSRGIGAAAALDLARSGADVCVNCRHDDEAARGVCGEIEALGRRAPLIVADMAKAADAERSVDEAVAALGGIDVLVHSAGGPAPGTIEEVPLERWQEAFDVHVHAAFHLCRRAIPAMRAAGAGAIVLISSAAAVRGCPGAIAYGTVKGAVLQFTRMLAREVADDNIRVNCVCPGIIRTRFHETMTSPAQAHNLAQRIPLHREGTVEDVAQAVHLLVTNEFMTGELITIDGGMSMQMCR